MSHHWVFVPLTSTAFVRAWTHGCSRRPVVTELGTAAGAGVYSTLLTLSKSNAEEARSCPVSSYGYLYIIMILNNTLTLLCVYVFSQALGHHVFTPCWVQQWMAGTSWPLRWTIYVLTMLQKMWSRTTCLTSSKVSVFSSSWRWVHIDDDNYKETWSILFIESMLFFVFFPVVKVPKKTLLMDALKEETEITYDFCMCNPPFFANQMEAMVCVYQPQIFWMLQFNSWTSNSHV